MIRAALGGLLGIFVLYATGAPLALGAHPLWAVQVIWIGGTLGCGLGILAASRPSWTARVIGLALTLGGYSAAMIGKMRFAASYAEDALAGQMWYFGWIAACTGCTLLLASIVTLHRRNT